MINADGTETLRWEGHDFTLDVAGQFLRRKVPRRDHPRRSLFVHEVEKFLATLEKMKQRGEVVSFTHARQNCVTSISVTYQAPLPP